MTEPATNTVPALLQTVLDCEDARQLAEFYRQLLGYQYRPGDEPPDPGEPDPHGTDWLCLRDRAGTPKLAFQQIEHSPRPTWPRGERPAMLHLDTTVATAAELQVQHRRALALGAELVYDRFDDPDEPLYVYLDPAGHPFCIFVG